MDKMKVKKLLSVFGFTIYFLSVIVLFYWVIKSGILYVFDTDEYAHMYLAWLVGHGYVPYQNFYTIHTPVFHVLLAIVYGYIGYTLDNSYVLRFVMVILLSLRILATARLVGMIYGKVSALAFVLLLLIDPVTQFAGMQIRPDNLMMLIYMLGYLVFAGAMLKKSRSGFFISGLLFGLSVVVNMKIAPIIAVLAVILFLYSIQTRTISYFFRFLIGSAVIPLFFIGYTLLAGTTRDMIQQVAFDSQLMNATRLFPISPGFFYRPGNWILFGAGGKSIIWRVFTIMPVAGFLGLIIGIFRDKQSKKKERHYLEFSMLATYGVAWITLGLVPSAFIQYYLITTWIYAVGTGVLIAFVWHLVKKPVLPNMLIWALCLYGISIVYINAIRANQGRTSITSKDDFARIEFYWQLIPPDQKVFPGLLFRPFAHPFTTVTFYPEIPLSIRARYPSVIDTLEKGHIQYALLSDYALSLLDGETRQYVSDHYNRSDADPDLRIRKP